MNALLPTAAVICSIRLAAVVEVEVVSSAGYKLKPGAVSVGCTPHADRVNTCCTYDDFCSGLIGIHFGSSNVTIAPGLQRVPNAAPAAAAESDFESPLETAGGDEVLR